MSEAKTPPSPASPKKSHAWFKPAIAVGAVVLVIAIIVIPKPKPPVVATEAPPTNVTVQTVVPVQNLADSVVLPAVIEPNRTIHLAAEISGRIESLGPQKGQAVKAGDLLIALNTDLLMPELDRAKAQLNRHQTEYERMRNLVERKATSRSDLDNAAMDRSISQAALNEIVARLQRSRITAPCAGILNDLKIEVGEYVQPGVPVAEIVETQTVKAVVDIPERDLGYFKKGQEATVLMDLHGQDQELKGEISYISVLADEQTRTTRIEVKLANPDGTLHSGQIVRVRLVRRQLTDVILIPLLAVIPMEDSKAVYIATNGKAERRSVELGLIRGDQIQVLSGLNANDDLIVAGHRFVAPGQPVQVIEPNDL